MADKETPDRKAPTGPVRILVTTATHLVPGDGYEWKLIFITNQICQYHWARDYDPSIDRWTSYGAQFGYDNRKCYILLDHGNDAPENDDDIPILWYRWTGDSLYEAPYSSHIMI